ncbi:hypothetical protein M1O20_06360, partial [Dehalococcoidia bacterium]|nr:hypothetical protein [Dehalococcoidia bacterium]
FPSVSFWLPSVCYFCPLFFASVDELAACLTTFSLSSLALTSFITKICPSMIYNDGDGKKLRLLANNLGSRHLTSFSRIIKKIQSQRFGASLLFLGSGRWIRTGGLGVMSPTSFHCAN